MNSSDDNCSVDLVADPNSANCDQVGGSVISTVTATDPSGNSAQCQTEVFISDPSFNCTACVSQCHADFQGPQLDDCLMDCAICRQNCAQTLANSLAQCDLIHAQEIATCNGISTLCLNGCAGNPICIRQCDQVRGECIQDANFALAVCKLAANAAFPQCLECD